LNAFVFSHVCFLPSHRFREVVLFLSPSFGCGFFFPHFFFPLVFSVPPFCGRVFDLVVFSDFSFGFAVVKFSLWEAYFGFAACFFQRTCFLRLMCSFYGLTSFHSVLPVAFPPLGHRLWFGACCAGGLWHGFCRSWTPPPPPLFGF